MDEYKTRLNVNAPNPSRKLINEWWEWREIGHLDLQISMRQYTFFTIGWFEVTFLKTYGPEKQTGSRVL